MDPQVRAFLLAAGAVPQPPIHTLPIETARRQFAGQRGVFHPFVEVTRVEDSRTAGGVPIRCYHPTDPPPTGLPAAVYFHGGGWVMGDLETHDTLCRHLALASGAVVVAVDYRRAPEHPFPAALDDAFDAVGHVVSHARELGVAPDRIAVAGDSAGGNLAAAVAIKARMAGGPSIVFQCLIYPVLDPGCDTPSYREFAEGFGLTRTKMEFFWKSYRGQRDGGDPLMAPVREPNLAGLPPALIVTAEYDVLRDEGAAYARRLRAAGVAAEWWNLEGMIHGFVHYAGAIHRGQAVLREIGRKLAKGVSPHH